MRKGFGCLYYGEGKGKTTAAIGQGVRAVGEGLTCIMVQFLDYNHNKEYIPLQKLEPDFRVFRFEKERKNFDCKDEMVLKEVQGEIFTAYQFSKKIVETGECDILILDGITDAITSGFLTEEEVGDLLKKRQSYMDLILTGSNKYDTLVQLCDYVFTISKEKAPQTEM